jgi:hypothetical protein
MGSHGATIFVMRGFYAAWREVLSNAFISSANFQVPFRVSSVPSPTIRTKAGTSRNDVGPLPLEFFTRWRRADNANEDGLP